MSGSDPKSHALHKAHQDAYRAYLRSLRDSLAKVDIEALDLSKPQALKQATLFSLGCIYSIYTFYTFYTWSTFNCYSCEACIAE